MSLLDDLKLSACGNCQRAVGEIEQLRKALSQCAADWSSHPGTVISAAGELNIEFQRRMQIAADALGWGSKIVDVNLKV